MEEIISRMIEKGYVVTVLDYMDSQLAACPALDYSVQAVRKRIIDGEFFADSPLFPKGKYSETIVVPAGYDVSYNNAYWAFDKHGADGDLEKIVEIWNNDFRGTNPDKIIRWTDANGNRKATQNAFDGSAKSKSADNFSAASFFDMPNSFAVRSITSPCAPQEKHMKRES